MNTWYKKIYSRYFSTGVFKTLPPGNPEKELEDLEENLWPRGKQAGKQCKGSKHRDTIDSIGLALMSFTIFWQDRFSHSTTCSH